jgi:hypothetical protein
MKLLLNGNEFYEYTKLTRINYLPGERSKRGGRTFGRGKGFVVISAKDLPEAADWSFDYRGRVYVLKLALPPYKSEAGTVTTFAEIPAAMS